MEIAVDSGMMFMALTLEAFERNLSLTCKNDKYERSCQCPWRWNGKETRMMFDMKLSNCNLLPCRKGTARETERRPGEQTNDANYDSRERYRKITV